jgi:SH3 domain-containing YSC84-like protein 1
LQSARKRTLGFVDLRIKDEESAEKVMQEILDAPDSIPKSVLDKAECVVILPSVLKLSFGLGSSYGRGVMTCRSGKSFHGSWSAPAMPALEDVSAGLQSGGNSTDFVLLLMSRRSATSILSTKVKLGGTATAAAGPVGRTTSAESDVTMSAEILSYSRARDSLLGYLLQVRRCAQTTAPIRSSVVKR